ncbi:hypothetical protein SAMN04515674_101205 [Pseudarcicella hirudinis]|uniref:Uncharacterized protein n=1 Tax=Pseudarcicella hirudinis TaxID=1079859 RepID=A0A1I5MA22_9BACT|nr:hypothetical protein SAMN04515674_101205 [Pseudarcicella hirudinis]
MEICFSRKDFCFWHDKYSNTFFCFSGDSCVYSYGFLEQYPDNNILIYENQEVYYRFYKIGFKLT